MKKQTKAKLPSVYEYGPGCRSPQAVPWMEGDGAGYLKPSLQRSFELKAQRKMWETQDKTVRNQAEYNGGSTFCLSKDHPPKVCDNV